MSVDSLAEAQARADRREQEQQGAGSGPLKPASGWRDEVLVQ
jgi:hypothetical protein